MRTTALRCCALCGGMDHLESGWCRVDLVTCAQCRQAIRAEVGQAAGNALLRTRACAQELRRRLAHGTPPAPAARRAA